MLTRVKLNTHEAISSDLLLSAYLSPENVEEAVDIPLGVLLWNPLAFRMCCKPRPCNANSDNSWNTAHKSHRMMLYSGTNRSKPQQCMHQKIDNQQLLWNHAAGATRACTFVGQINLIELLGDEMTVTCSSNVPTFAISLFKLLCWR